jgi:hypothetical protein
VLQKNHTVYDLPQGIVVEMFSDEYCQGDATLVSKVAYDVRYCSTENIFVTSPVAQWLLYPRLKERNFLVKQHSSKA